MSTDLDDMTSGRGMQPLAISVVTAALTPAPNSDVWAPCKDQIRELAPFTADEVHMLCCYVTMYLTEPGALEEDRVQHPPQRCSPQARTGVNHHGFASPLRFAPLRVV